MIRYKAFKQYCLSCKKRARSSQDRVLFLLVKKKKNEKWNEEEWAWTRFILKALSDLHGLSLNQ